MSIDDNRARHSFQSPDRHRRREDVLVNSDLGASGEDREVPRVAPSRPLYGVEVHRPLAWIEWFGVGRLLGAAVSVVAIAAGMWWLLRAPPVPVEQSLPFASGDTAIAGTVSRSLPSQPAPPETIVSPTVPSLVVVHVAGNVEHPGVYTLAPGSRVADAVDAAGGASPTGDLNSLNLAAAIVDGGRVYVPERGEIDPASVVGPADSAEAQADMTSSGDGLAPGRIDINTATAAELETLPGIGPATAAAIVDDRQRNGPFVSVDELERVRGIGPAKLAGLTDLITT